MACAVCRIIHEKCEDNCCFEKYFGPQDVEKFQKIRKNNYSVKFMRATLKDDDISDEDKKALIEKWYGKEKKAGSSSSASKCQASSSNEVGCKNTCLFAGLFSRGAKKTITEQGKAWVEAGLKPKLEKLLGEIEEELVVAQIMLDLENMGEIDEVLAAQIMFDFKNKGDRQ